MDITARDAKLILQLMALMLAAHAFATCTSSFMANALTLAESIAPQILHSEVHACATLANCLKTVAGVVPSEGHCIKANWRYRCPVLDEFPFLVQCQGHADVFNTHSVKGFHLQRFVEQRQKFFFIFLLSSTPYSRSISKR